jgi:glucose-1-phosphate cytidylyltransferase
MVEIGGRPILWHIMKIYSFYGINDFIICCGYKGYMIKEFFANYFLHRSDVVFDIHHNRMKVLQNGAEPWQVTLIDTGHDTLTGGRLKRVGKYLDHEDFCFTYGDGLCNVDINRLIDFHKAQGTLATLTAVQPPGRFGAFKLANDATRISNFREKPDGDGAWINGGYFVLSPKVLDYIDSDSTVWEQAPMSTLAKENQLSAYAHSGFWHPMDTLRDKQSLETMWSSGQAPWRVWQ